METKENQLAQLREWLAVARTKKYGKRDKRRFARLEYDGAIVTMDLSEAIDWVSDADEGTYTLGSVFMTEAGYEKLPEFEGF